MANTTTDTILSSSDKVLLGFVAGPTIVSSYALSTFLPLAMQGLLFRVIIGAMPGIGKLFGLQEYSKIYKVWNNINGLIFLFATATGVTVILFNNSFLKAWVGDGFFPGDITNVLLIVMILQDTFIKHDGYIINATLDLKKKVYLSLVCSILFVVLGYFLIGKLGIAGLCISLILGKFVLFLGQRSFLRGKIQNDLVKFSFKHAQPLVTSIIMLAGASYLTTFFQSVSLFKMLLLAPIAFGISFLIFCWIGLRKSQRTELWQIFTSIKFFKSN